MSFSPCARPSVFPAGRDAAMKGIFKLDRLLPEADAMQPRSGGGALTGLTAGTASADRRLLRVFRDLAEFAETPEDEPFMGSLLLQELHWRLLAGPLGGGSSGASTCREEFRGR